MRHEMKERQEKCKSGAQEADYRSQIWDWIEEIMRRKLQRREREKAIIADTRTMYKTNRAILKQG